LNWPLVKRWIISVPLKQIYFVFSPHYKIHSLTFLLKVKKIKLEGWITKRQKTQMEKRGNERKEKDKVRKTNTKTNQSDQLST
jgi:hypothetical protein